MSKSPAARHEFKRPPHVVILAYDGVDELDLFGAFSILAKARDHLASLQIASTMASFTSSGGVEINATPLHEVSDLSEIVVIPGGRGALETARSNALTPFIQAARQRDAWICCCCSGALLVASALKLNSGRLAIHRKKRGDLAQFFDGSIVAELTDDDGIASVGGATSASAKSVMLAFFILSQLDPSLPEKISERTEIDWRHG